MPCRMMMSGSARSQWEVRLGLALLPEGRRRQTLSGLAEEMFQEEFFEKCLPFDYQAAEVYAQIVSSRSRCSPTFSR